MPQYAMSTRTGCHSSTNRMDNAVPKGGDTEGAELWVEADMEVMDVAADVDVDSVVNKGATSIKLQTMMTMVSPMILPK